MKPHEHIIMAIARERERQSAMYLTPEHLLSCEKGELALAAASYAANASDPKWGAALWPLRWLLSWRILMPPREGLIHAAALIVAEIERLDRLKVAGKEG